MSDRQGRVADWLNPLVFLLISVGLLLIPARVTDPVQSAALCLMAPAYARVQGFLNGVSAFLGGALLSRGGSEEARRLRDVIAKQEAVIAQQQDVIRRQAEYIRQLTELAGEGILPPRTAIIRAEVIGYDPAQERDIVLVNAGSVHGVEKDYPVLVGHIGIGKVIQVGEWASKVMLITDVASREVAKVVRTGERGILEGTGGETCLLKYVPATAEAKAGDHIVAAPQARAFPPGVLLGEVLGPGKGRPGQPVFLSVRPGWDLSRLESLVILAWRSPAAEFTG